MLLFRFLNYGDNLHEGNNILKCRFLFLRHPRSAYAHPELNTKLYVLTGFLGSGKTTALLKLLERLKGSRIGVIQNEFGKLGIDGTILRNDDIQMVEINRGSIFCTCQKLNFVKALADMARQDFDYLFVESSGWGPSFHLAGKKLHY